MILDHMRVMQGFFTLNANFTINTGARVAVIGPSGSGKSTLLSAMSGFLEFQSGRMLWHGDDITTAPPGERPIAMLFQDNNLFTHLTARQNVGLGLRPTLKLTDAQQAQVDEAINRVGLAGYADSRPGEMSGGQQSRIALARLLIQNRPLIFLDEPFAALGPALKAEMLELVSALLEGSGATLVMVTHDLEDAKRLAPDTILVEDGRAHAPLPTLDLLNNPPPALKAYLG